MSQASILARAKLELREFSASFEARTFGDGTFIVFDLPVRMVQASSLLVAVNNVQLTQGTDYTVEEQEGVVHLTTAPALNAVVYVAGYHNLYFTDTELTELVDAAFVQHVHDRTDSSGLPITYATLPPIEEYLVALLAVIQALWAEATKSATEIDIIQPDGGSIPRSQRFRQLLEVITAKETQYRELASALNVGPFRIEVFTLRRVSRQTGRLVPVYKQMEYDDLNHGFAPIAGPVGTLVTVHGANFTGATAVKVGTTSAITFTVINDTTVTFLVPSGATDGAISVVTPGGTATSAFVFKVGAQVPYVNAGPQRLHPPIDAIEG